MDPQSTSVPGSTASAIPGPLLAKLQELKEVLTQQGVLQCRNDNGRPGIWRLRYRAFDPDRGYTVHRSLSIGSDETVAYDVQKLIETWRSEAQAARNAARLKKAELDAVRQERRALIKAAQELAGGGLDRKARIAREIKDVMNGSPMEALAYIWGEQYLRPNRPGGRPRKSGLW